MALWMPPFVSFHPLIRLHLATVRCSEPQVWMQSLDPAAAISQDGCLDEPCAVEPLPGGSSSPRAGGTGALALDTTIDAGVAAAATTRVVRAVNAGVLVRGDDATRRALLGALTKRLLATAEATTCTTSAADAAALLLCIDAIDLLTELTQAHASALDTALEKTCRGCQSNVWFCCGGDRQGIRSTCRGGSETCSWHAKLSNRWHGVLVFAACGTCMPGDSPARRAATANPWDACAHSEPFCDICCVAHRQGR